MNPQAKNDQQAKPVKRHQPGMAVHTGVRGGVRGAGVCTYEHPCIAVKFNDP